MQVTIAEIKSRFATDHLIKSHLGPNTTITGIRAVDDCGPGDLVFVEKEILAEQALSGKPSGVVVTEQLVGRFEDSKDLGILVSDNVKLAHAMIKQAYADRDFIDDQWGRIHPSAVVHPSAQISESAFIGPNCVVGQDARIGDGCRILPGAIIENGVEMGKTCIIYPNAVIGYNCLLGNEVEVGAGSVLGSEGYGFAQDAKNKSYRVPQTGRVILEDQVRIGAGNCIDRAVYGATRIGAGTKTDNLCHIAHNVQVGEDCLLTAMLCVAGSSKIGNRVITSGQTGILDHIEICDDVVLLHRAGVTKSIKKSGLYAGLPLQPLNEFLKNSACYKKLAEMSFKMKQLAIKIKGS